MTDKTVLACIATVVMCGTVCGQDLRIHSFNRSYWTYDTTNNYISFSTALGQNTTGINADFATDYIGACKIDYVTAYNIAPNDSGLAYQQLFNGGGNASIRMSLPLFNICGQDSRHRNYAGLVLNPRTNMTLPVTNSDYQGLSLNQDIGLETVFNLAGENSIINLKGVFRSAYAFGGANYLGQTIAGGSRRFAYQTLSLQLNVRQMYITTLLPLAVWAPGFSNYSLPNYIGLGFRY